MTTTMHSILLTSKIKSKNIVSNFILYCVKLSQQKQMQDLQKDFACMLNVLVFSVTKALSDVIPTLALTVVTGMLTTVTMILFGTSFCFWVGIAVVGIQRLAPKDEPTSGGTLPVPGWWQHLASPRQIVNRKLIQAMIWCSNAALRSCLFIC